MYGRKMLAGIAFAVAVGVVYAVPMMDQALAGGDCETVYASTMVTKTTSPGGNVVGPSAVPTMASSSPPTMATSPSNPGGGNTASGFRNVLYFTNWAMYQANFHAPELPADKVTHLLYSFADIRDGEVVSSDSFADVERVYPGDNWEGGAKGCVGQLYKLKQNNRKMKVLLSIGGWTWSSKFVPVAATEAGRQRFATSAVKLMSDWGMDGLDIDWEYPSNQQEAADFVALLKLCREELDKYAAQHAPGYHFGLTVASPAGPQYKDMDLRNMDPYIDAWHLMAYDFAGAWDTVTGHQANLFPVPGAKYSAEAAITYYTSQGIRLDKIVLGMPLYGRSFANTGGLGQPFNGVGPGSIEPGIVHFKSLPRPGATEVFDAAAGTAYSYDSKTREFISYDTIQSASFKADYLKNKGMAGALYWEAAGDGKGAGSIVVTVAGKMGTLDSTDNLLSYPTSQYWNIRDNKA